MKKAILLTLFYFPTILCFSQSIKNFREPDSLKKKNYLYLKKRFEETIKSEPSNAEIFANTIITRAKKEKNNSMLADSYLLLFKSKHLPTYLDSMLIVSVKSKNLGNVSLAYLHKGNYYYSVSNYSLALQNYLNARESSKKNSDTYNIINFNIGLLKLELRNYSDAQQLFLGYKTYLEKKNQTNRIDYISCLYALAYNSSEMNELYYSNSYVQQGLAKIQSNNKENYSNLLLVSGINSFKKKDYLRAINTLENVSKIIRNNRYNPENLALSEFYIGKCLFFLNNKQFLNKFNTVDSIIIKTNSVTEKLREAYPILIEYYKKQNNKEKQLHYIERLLVIDSIFIKNNIRHYDIVAIDYSEYLEEVLTAAKGGLRIIEIIEILTKGDVDYDEAQEFVDELIANQILISEFEPSVSGQEFVKRLVAILKDNFGVDDENVKFIESIEEKLEKLDNSVENCISDYIYISELIKKREISFDLKFLFQCDLVVSTQFNVLDKKILKNIEHAIKFVNRIRKIKSKNYLDQFKEAFYERYEEHEMPLSTVLDPEIGIGYGLNTQSNDDNPLIDDLFLLPADKDIKEPREIKWTIIDDIIQKKIIKALQRNESIVQLADDDFAFLPEPSYADLPETVSFLTEIVEESDVIKIKFSGGGGGSAANLLARFCHSDENLNEFVNEIINFETEYNSGKIIAEIVHLPEARVGNILSRPDFRNFEIPYLARSVKSFEKQIGLDDIMVSVRNNKILLRSKRHNKEILPRLTNAHNYSNSNTLPIYHFLSDMQFNNYSGLYVDVSNLDHLFKFIPRIEYKNIILSCASWNFQITDIKPLIEGKKQNNLKEQIKIFKREFSLPDFVLLSDGDNELLIDMNNLTSVEMFIDTVKNRQNLKLTEFIFNSTRQIVKNSSGQNFSNEIIMSFYKN